jgi:predicted PurR-regulated permease PerM
MQTLKDLLKDKKLMKYSLFVVFTMALVYILYFLIKNMDVILGGIVAGLGSLIGALSPLFIGILLAYILNPAVELFNNKLIKRIYRDLPSPEQNVKRHRKQRLIAAAVTYISIIAAILMVFYIFTSLLIGQLQFTSLSKMIDSITNYFISIEHTFKYWAAHVPANALTEKMSSFSDTVLNWLSSNFNAQSTIEHLTTIGGAVVKFFLGLLVSFWLILDKDYFLSGCERLNRALLSENGNKRLKRNLRQIDYILSQFIRGVCLDAVIIAVLSSIALSICGLKYAVIIGIFAGLCNVIPYFGPIMGMIPAFIVGFLNGNIVSGIIPVIALFIVQQIDSNFIYPKVVGSSTGLHPLIVLLAVVVGGVYGGIIGMLIAVPAASILKLYAMKTISFIERRKKKKSGNASSGKERRAG